MSLLVNVTTDLAHPKVRFALGCLFLPPEKRRPVFEILAGETADDDGCAEKEIIPFLEDFRCRLIGTATTPPEVCQI